MAGDDNTRQYENKQRLKAAKSEVNNITKDKWLQKYSHQILRLWLQRQMPFGITCNYTAQIEEDLAEFYEDPLKRKFIDTTYY
jgi:methionyl-tRNA synthetase